jgi:hypothetical protein
MYPHPFGAQNISELAIDLSCSLLARAWCGIEHFPILVLVDNTRCESFISKKKQGARENNI